MANAGAVVPTMTDYAVFLTSLIARGDVEFITYDNLAWGEDQNYVNAYPEEWSRWDSKVRSIRRRKRKVSVLIQHDTDSGAAATIAMAKVESSMGAVSSIMTFARRPLKIGEPQVENYAIDWSELRLLQQEGFVIGYHCNAYQVAHFQGKQVGSEYLRDLELLNSQGLNIKYFTVHGGKSGPDGLSNSSFDYPELTGSKVRWVNTRFSPRFNGYFSDGGSGGDLSGEQRLEVMVAFAAGMKPGGRYRMLIHPQYFAIQDVDCVRANIARMPQESFGIITAAAALTGTQLSSSPVPDDLKHRLKERIRDALNAAGIDVKRLQKWRQTSRRD